MVRFFSPSETHGITPSSAHTTVKEPVDALAEYVKSVLYKNNTPANAKGLEALTELQDELELVLQNNQTPTP